MLGIPLHHFILLENISVRTMSDRTTVKRSRASWRGCWSWYFVVLMLTITGCSLATTYRYVDRIILWKLDHYFDLNRDQRHDVAQRLTPLLDKHRHEALPQYENFLQEARLRVERGLTGPDIDWAYATYDQLRTDLFERLVSDGGVFLASIDDRQVRIFESALHKDNAKAVRFIQTPESERLKKKAQTALDLVKDWLGPLTKEQQAQIIEWSVALPDVQPMWVAYQQQRQQELLTLLHQPRTPEQLARELRAIFVYHDQIAPQPYQNAVHQMRADAKTMALAIDQSATPKQRRHAIAKLEQLINQIHDLQAG